MLQTGGSQLGSHPFSFLLKQPGPLPARRVLTTGPHPGKGLSQQGPVAPVLERSRGYTLLFMSPNTTPQPVRLLAPKQCRGSWAVLLLTSY